MKREIIMERFRKTVAVLMCAVMLVVSGVINDYTPVYADTESQEHGFEIDESLYNVNWQETSDINVYVSVDTYNYNFKKGTYLGYAKVYTGFATTKKQVDKKYYQRVLVHASMRPQTVKGNNKGMSQYLTIQVGNEKRMKNVAIEPSSTSGSTSYSTSNSFSLGGNIGYNNGVEAGAELGFGIESSCSYTRGALKVITNVDDNGYATWNYDYISSKNNADQNAYLFGSTEQRGLFMWNMGKNVNGFYATLQLKVTATFGGGNESTNTRAQARRTGANNLGSASTKMRLVYNVPYKVDTTRERDCLKC